MKQTLKIFLAIAFASVVVTACKKKTDDPAPGNNNNNSSVVGSWNVNSVEVNAYQNDTLKFDTSVTFAAGLFTIAFTSDSLFTWLRLNSNSDTELFLNGTYLINNSIVSLHPADTAYAMSPMTYSINGNNLLLIEENTMTEDGTTFKEIIEVTATRQ